MNRVAVFSTKPYDREFMSAANERFGYELFFLEPRLTEETAALARGADVVCPFVNDDVGEGVLERLSEFGVRMLSLRSAGFNHVDLAAARRLGITVTHVPEYSPYAVAEHTMALILALNRKIYRAHARVREGNFSLEGMLGFDLHGKTVGIVGTGRIGRVFGRIAHGFGMRILASDPFPSPEVESLGGRYVGLDELLAASDVITLHAPLTSETHHLIGEEAFALMGEGVMLVNTSRGALVDAGAAIGALKSGRLSALGLDVYEEEAGLFFEDKSLSVISDDTLMRLLTFPNVLITGHQAFFTREAMQAIAQTTLANVSTFEEGGPTNVVPYPAEESAQEGPASRDGESS